MSVVGLARGVILQALRDALDLSLGREREDALRFFEDGRLEFWAEVGELSAEKVRRAFSKLLEKQRERMKRRGRGIRIISWD